MNGIERTAAPADTTQWRRVGGAGEQQPMSACPNAIASVGVALYGDLGTQGMVEALFHAALVSDGMRYVRTDSWRTDVTAPTIAGAEELFVSRGSSRADHHQRVGRWAAFRARPPGAMRGARGVLSAVGGRGRSVAAQQDCAGRGGAESRHAGRTLRSVEGRAADSLRRPARVLGSTSHGTRPRVRSSMPLLTGRRLLPLAQESQPCRPRARSSGSCRPRSPRRTLCASSRA